MSRITDIWLRKPAGMVLGLDFSGGRIDSPTGHTGTLVGNATVAAGTRYLALDGVGDHLSFADSADHSFTVAGQDQPFSAGGWVYLNSNTTSNKAIIFKGTGSPLAVEWAIKCANGGGNDPAFILYNSGATRFIGRRTASALSTGQWVHVFGTYSGGETPASVKVYINGVRSDSVDFNTGSYTGMSNTAALLRIGGTDTPGEYINGNLADIRVYNRELTQPEIAQIYNAGAARIAQGGTP